MKSTGIIVFAALVFTVLSSLNPVLANAAGKMYVTSENGVVIVANLDGTGATSLGDLGGTLVGPRGIALDTVHGKLYVASPGNNTVVQANLDGTGPVALNLGGLLDGPYAIALDTVHGKIYVASQNAENSGSFSTIVQANLDGSGAVNLGNLNGLLVLPQAIVLDITNGKMYVMNSYFDTILIQANLDGTGAVNLGNVGIPSWGLALDSVDSKLYFTDFYNGTVHTINFDGTGNVSLNSPNAQGVTGIALDVTAGKMYIANQSYSTITQANLDGTGVTNLGNLNGTLSGAFGIAIDTKVYNFGGFLSPLNLGKSFKLGSTIPVKFQLTDNTGNFISTAHATITLWQYSGNTPVNEVLPVSTSAADSGTTFRYDSTASQYIFNLNTKGLSVGTWMIQVTLDDGTTESMLVSLK